MNIKRPEGSGELVMVAPEMLPAEDDGMTVGTIDSGHMEESGDDSPVRS